MDAVLYSLSFFMEMILHLAKLFVQRKLNAGATQFFSRRSVPKEQLKRARHFNAGKGLEKSSPAGGCYELQCSLLLVRGLRLKFVIFVLWS